MTRAERVDRYREKKARRGDGATVRYVARQLNAHRCHAVVTQSKKQRPQTPILPVHSCGAKFAVPPLRSHPSACMLPFAAILAFILALVVLPFTLSDLTSWVVRRHQGAPRGIKGHQGAAHQGALRETRGARRLFGRPPGRALLHPSSCIDILAQKA